MVGDLPTGTVTFLFTDIEGSTRLWEQDRPAMEAALAAHDLALRSAIEFHRGTLFKHTVPAGLDHRGSAFQARPVTPRI